MIVWTLGVQVGAAAPLDTGAVIRTLSSRDPVACAAVDATVETWREVVRTAEGPPWVPMRAAQCLVERHAVAAQDDLAAWVIDPESLGLGLLVLGQLDRLPADLALRLAHLALAEGPAPERASPRIAASDHAAVRALVTP
jgi:hypothetical protein